ncbi:MAG: preprotein translocase subunit SecG [Desulfosalsimonas sp.]
MHALIIAIHLLVCFTLISIVLLQSGKGASMGAMFGGAGNQTLFGQTGASTFLSKATTVAAVVFMVTSLTLAVMSKSGDDSVVKDMPESGQGQQEAPLTPPEQQPGQQQAPPED